MEAVGRLCEAKNKSITVRSFGADRQNTDCLDGAFNQRRFCAQVNGAGFADKNLFGAVSA
jgi:hypothetical protein